MQVRNMLCVLISVASLGALGTATAAGKMATTTVTPHATTPKMNPSAPRSPAHITGQPNQTCGSASAPNTPGNAASAPGSAFNPSGTAGGVYAGEQTQNSRNTASVSQYDVACAHQK